MKARATFFLAVVVLVWVELAAGQGPAAEASKLRFQADGAKGFSFDTGELRGKLRAGGKSTGLSSVTHVKSGMRLDSSMGLFSHYRVFTTDHRYGTAAWDWPSEAKLLADGAVSVRWPAAPDRPFELRAVYRWAAPRVLDLETTVEARTNLPKFESFLASYFAEGFTNAAARVQGPAKWMAAERTNGVWQAFPRDAAARLIIGDGRWKYPPNPVDWVMMPPLAEPLGLRRCPLNGLQAVVMSPPGDCFALLMPFQADPHRSLYLCLFGRDLKAGETASARARLFIDVNGSEQDLEKAYERYLRGEAK